MARRQGSAARAMASERCAPLWKKHTDCPADDVIVTAVRTDMTRLRRRDRPAGGPACTLVADDEPAVRRLVFQDSQVGASPASFAGASRPLLRSAWVLFFLFILIIQVPE